MARRLPNRKKQKYTILWSDRLAGHVVSREVFNRAVASQWIIAEPSTMDENGNTIPSTSARVAHGVKAVLRAGALCLEDMARKALIWIYTSWISIDRDSPIIQGRGYQDEIEWKYGNSVKEKVVKDGKWVMVRDGHLVFESNRPISERMNWEASL
jgi:hypothetical protein